MEKLKEFLRTKIFKILIFCFSFLIFLVIFFFSTGISYVKFEKIKNFENPEKPKEVDKKGEFRLKMLKPKNPYLIIDRTHNRMYLKDKDGNLIKEIVCSAGSGGVLEDPQGNRKWVFDTPKGKFTIKNIIEDPVWVKPDWAFIEEGEPIPKDYSERLERGMLGEYALDLGGGYFIHGTLYERLLGRNVTHGCIRVGREDLRLVVKTLKTGYSVYIF
ncbi:MAG: L,D-transpeptidase [Thermoanaerobaculia bacterium]